METYFHRDDARKSCVVDIIITLILVLLCYHRDLSSNAITSLPHSVFVNQSVLDKL